MHDDLNEPTLAAGHDPHDPPAYAESVPMTPDVAEGSLHVPEVDAVQPSVPAAVEAPETARQTESPAAVEGPPRIEALASEVPVEAAPVAEAPPVAEPPPAAEAPAIAEAALVAEVPPVADAFSVTEPAIVAEPAPAPEAVSVAEAASVTETAPAVATGPTEAQKAQAAAKAEERRIRAQQAWERVVTARESGEILSGTVTAAVKGGLLVDVGGIRGFLPASQVRPPQGISSEALVKTRLPLKIIDIDAARRRVVVSHRRAMEEERRANRAELLRSLQVGQMREGVVVRLAEFGAFVDLGGVDGLIPMRELAFERIEKASDVVHIGEKLQVEVLRIDENGKKISLSRRNALPDPWRDHADVLRRGKTIEGKVVAKEPRLQVEIAPGVIGSVRESDADPADYEIGEAIEVSVRFVDRATRRIALSTTHDTSAITTPTTSSGFAPLGEELRSRTSR